MREFCAPFSRNKMCYIVTLFDSCLICTYLYFIISSVTSDFVHNFLIQYSCIFFLNDKSLSTNLPMQFLEMELFSLFNDILFTTMSWHKFKSKIIFSVNNLSFPYVWVTDLSKILTHLIIFSSIFLYVTSNF